MKAEHWRSLGYLIIRLALGGILLAHGSQQFLGWFGGAGWQPAVASLDQQLGISPFWANAAIFIEFFGGLSLLLGFFTRLAALGSSVLLLLALLKVSAIQTVLMSWTAGTGETAGLEMLLALLAMSLMLLITGAGRLSVDYWLVRKFWPVS